MSYLRKVLLVFVLTLSSLFMFTGCKKDNTLLFLNWGEYISDELVEAFEEKYDCRVIVDIAESNELFYSKLKSGTTKYDLCCPSDYMIEKMYLTGLIEKIDLDLLPNYKENIFMDEVYEVINGMNNTMYSLIDDYQGDINSYHIPYFWGTFGLMYNKKCDFFKDNDQNGTPDIFDKVDAWDLYFFDTLLNREDSLPSNVRVGIYNAVRLTYAAAMIYDCKNPNIELDNNVRNRFEEILSRRRYDMWGSDTLKHSILADNLDIAFNYTGDCLDMAYVKIQDGVPFEELSFGTYTPELTIAHIDSLVIPTGARHKDLAYEFLNFMLDPVNEWMNARNVGYCPPLQACYDMIVNKESPDSVLYPYAYFEQTEEELFWLENWSKAISSTYPLNSEGKSTIKGIPLSYFDSDDLKELNNIVNNIKTGK